MTSPPAVLLGVQTPQIVHLPPDVHSLDAATETIELADAYGVAGGYPLDESQRFTLNAALGERRDGTWAAATVADFEPRQSGKNDTLAARELAGLILFGEKLIIHTAHEFPTANESFLRLVAVFENWDDLRAKVARIRYANGEQGIELLSGQRLKYRARTGGSGRGFAKADLVVYDEAQHLQAEHVAASGPARLANPNNQSWYMGSGGLSTSANAWRLRKRALAGDGGRFAYVEHTAEDISYVDGQLKSFRPDILDREAWALAHPAYGHRVSDEALASLYEELGPELFGRECLNLWDAEPGTSSGALTIDQWLELKDESSTIASHHQFAIDVSPDRKWSSIGAAGRRSDGRLHVEVVERRAGTGWLLDVAGAVWREWGVPFRIERGSPAASFISLFMEQGIEVAEVAPADHARAVGMVLDAVNDGSLRHIGGASLNVAAVAAELRKSGESVVWARRSPKSDISPLVAVTLAVGGVPGVTDDDPQIFF
jgi:hypothetical protein